MDGHNDHYRDGHSRKRNYDKYDYYSSRKNEKRPRESEGRHRSSRDSVQIRQYEATSQIKEKTAVSPNSDEIKRKLERLEAWKRKKGIDGGSKPLPVKDAINGGNSHFNGRAAPEKIDAWKLYRKVSRVAANSAQKVTLDLGDDQTDSPKQKILKCIDEAEKIEPGKDTDDEDALDAFMSKNCVEMDKPIASRASFHVIGDDIDILDDEHDNQGDTLIELARTKLKTKDLIIENHSKIKYEPFRKRFYVEPLDLKDLDSAQVDEMRLELEGIQVRGKDYPKVIKSWAHCGLPANVLEVIKSLNYTKPTAIQCQAIPTIMCGRDVIGVAKTGSGKTAAFLLPMFRHIKDQRPVANLEGPIALIMTPTRELAVQIYRECRYFLKVLNIRATCAYGGAPIRDQIADLKRGAEIVVCTPGRMIDVLAANQGRVTNLRRVTYLVLDEADRMFDLGFEPQVMKIVNNVRPDRQVVFFSATFPRQMEGLAKKLLVDPIEIIVGGRSIVAKEITQIVEVREEGSKFFRTLQILGELYNTDEDARTLIFVDRQEAADSLLRELMRRGYPSNSIHGGKDQFDRDSSIADFKAGVFPVLVATSVAARGLDIKNLKLVINFDCPNHLEDYVHRVGRTGRAGNTGLAVTFVTPSQGRFAIEIAKALELSGCSIPDELKSLCDEFMQLVKNGKERIAGTGFGGKGLEKIDKQREIMEKFQRKQYGEEEEVDQQLNSSDVSDDEKADDTLKQIRLAAKSVKKTEVKPKTSATEIVKGERGDFQASLEINDYPQRARWAVTNRANLVKVLDQTGTSVTTKGQMIPHGKVPGPGEEKLYLLIEGETQVAVQNCIDELSRLLQEGLAASLESERLGLGASSGRYSVV